MLEVMPPSLVSALQLVLSLAMLAAGVGLVVGLAAEWGMALR